MKRLSRCRQVHTDRAVPECPESGAFATLVSAACGLNYDTAIMRLAKVVIVGRPNVGKSSIFNWLAGRRLAIVDDMPGVTRDRLAHLVEVGDRYIELVDTGGIGIEDSDDLTAEIERQIAIAIDQADLILLVVDARSGMAPLDETVTRRLRGIGKPVLCLANKADAATLDPQADEFYRLGFNELLKVSVKQNRNKAALLELIARYLPAEDKPERMTEPAMKIALVGRRNVGKSTFINTLTQDERMIVSAVPGTTRDSVDVRFTLDGKSFLAIDTPGLRKGKSVRTDIDFYGMHRAQRSIRRADVVLMLFDAGQRISQVDKQLCKYVADQYKPCLFVVNKWDLMVKHMPTERWADYLRETFRAMQHVPIAFITGQTGKNMKTLLNHAQMLFKQSRQRVGTGELNRLVRRAMEHHPPPLVHHRRPKVFYAAQIDIQPPTIVLVCGKPSDFKPSYQKYLLGVFRDELSFGEVPIKLYLHRRSGHDQGARANA